MGKSLFEQNDDNQNVTYGLWWRLAGLLIFGWAFFVAISLGSYSWRDIPTQYADNSAAVKNFLGIAGAWHAYSCYMIFGAGAWFFFPSFLGISVIMMRGRAVRWWRLIGMLTVIASASCILQMASVLLGKWAGPDGVNIGGDPGGCVGALFYERLLAPWIGTVGSSTVFALLFFVGLLFSIGPSTVAEFLRVAAERSRAARDRERLLENEERGADREEEKRNVADEKERRRLEREAIKESKRSEKEAAREERARAAQEERDRREKLFEEQKRAVEEEDLRRREALEKKANEPAVEADETPEPRRPKHYKLPSSSTLLEPPPVFTPVADDSREKSALIEETLAQFDIQVKTTNVVRGPVITRFELLPAPGVRVNKITAYSDNLQMALRAKSIRILTPIPGHGVIGIEVPNDKARIVTLGEIARGRNWREACGKMALPVLLGKDVAGTDLIVDLAKMPHLLIAGATGSGKSACINAILAGLLLSRTPDELRLLMVDPKMVEFMPYAGLPHLVVPVITDPKKVAVSLQWAIAEMQRRLKLFSKVGVRNIGDYNNIDRPVQGMLFGEGEENPEEPRKLPYIVIIMDEIADIMMTAQAEVEGRIARLAQLSRAVGIHMILATQRPSVKVITGTIKANFPGRVAFQVISTADSRTILDAGGADALIGRGDMLFMNPQGSSITRGQGSWISDKEIRGIVDFMKEQGDPVYEASIKERLDKTPDSTSDDGFSSDSGSGSDGTADDGDAVLMKKAMQIINETRRATTSNLQRRLRIGYNRAARLMDELEEKGFIGPANGNDPREILVDLGAEIGDNEPNG